VFYINKRINILKIINKFILDITTPNIIRLAKSEDKNIYYHDKKEKKVLIPEFISFEIFFILDVLLSSYFFTVLLTWFGQGQAYKHYGNVIQIVLTFALFVLLIAIIQHYKKNNQKI